MPEILPVHINREELHSLDVPASFEATGSFDVELRNHGEPLHVHLHLDDALSDVATIDATNHYIDRESSRPIHVDVDDDASLPVHGKLKVVSAYGSQTRYIDVELIEPIVDESTVQVDESLAHPQPTSEQPSAESVALRPELLVLSVGIVALVVALVAALVVRDALVLFAALLVLAGVGVAMYLLFTEREVERV